jgi:hypothetical protein
MFGPATTYIHQGSYLTMLMIITGLAAVLASLPRLVAFGLLAVQGIVFAVNWVVSPLVGTKVDAFSLVAASLGLIGLAAVLGYVYRLAPAEAAEPAAQWVDSVRPSEKMGV